MSYVVILLMCMVVCFLYLLTLFKIIELSLNEDKNVQPNDDTQIYKIDVRGIEIGYFELKYITKLCWYLGISL